MSLPANPAGGGTMLRKRNRSAFCLASCVFVLSIVAMPFSLSPQVRNGSQACGGNSTVDAMGASTAKLSRDFLAQLQSAVKANDKRQIAGMISYPLLVIRSGKQTRIQQRKTFVANYDQIFTAPIREAILHQSAQCLFGNDRGAMVGRGEVWFTEQQGSGMKIITVNESASSM
jgi:hypothetical protein